ncbi:MAG: type II toxin-antitoxin system VapC family toxin [Candidatus Bathyarchaeia archaeon]
MLYLDSNIFIYAAIDTKEQGKKAKALLKKIQLSEEKAETSALTYDEVFWAVKKHDLETAVNVCEALLDFPNLKIVPADRELAFSALRLVRECGLDPRDALHAATALAEKADCIVSTDAHFGRVTGLKRRDL